MVNGLESSKIGLRLYDFADLLKGLGAWNAVNLDGGGSSTFIYLPGGKTIGQPKSILALFEAAKPVSGNPSQLNWKLAPVPANQTCISYPQADVTNPAQLCLPSFGKGYRPVYANFGFRLTPGAK
jgi:hypothetical protein